MTRPILSILLVTACGGGTPAPAKPAETHEHGHHGPLGHRFDDAERWAKVFDDPARDAWQRPADVVALLELQPGMVVADLGAGTGYFLPHLSPAVGPGGKVLALDVEPSMVDHMIDRATKQGLTNVEARLVPFDDPALPPRGVDRVLIVDTWHHIPDRPAYTRKLAAGLEPGGRVLIVDFTLESEMGPPRGERIAPEDVVRELEAGGLAATIVAEELPEQYVVVGRLP